MAETAKPAATDKSMAQAFREKQAQRHKDGKPQTDFFVAVRERGVLNTMMSEPARIFEEKNPGLRTKWEYAPLNGDNTLQVQREAQGFRVVAANEVSGKEDEKGPVRRGDMVLMAAPGELVEELAMQDALAAYEDAKLPETTYKEHVRGVRVRLRDGTIQEGRPVGTVRKAEEVKELPSAEEK